MKNETKIVEAENYPLRRRQRRIIVKAIRSDVYIGLQTKTSTTATVKSY